MCLTIPARIIKIIDSHASPIKKALVRDSRGERRLDLLVPDVAPGDWVLYSSNSAIRKIDPDDAREILELLEPHRHIEIAELAAEFREILEASHTRQLGKEEITRLLSTDDPLEMEALFSEANTVRQANLKDFFCIHGIVEFSNHCVRDCSYCGLRKGSAGPSRYRMMPDEIVATVHEAVNGRGYKLIVLQSGDDFHYTDDMLCEIIRRIKESCRVFIFMSVGERGLESYRRMKEAGASGVLFRFETSKESIYSSLHPGQSLADRLAHLKGMKEMGYYVASGFLIGLPGQTMDDLAEDILTMKSIGTSMVSIGPFIPSTGTPLASSSPGDAMMTLKATAVSRLLMPKAKIPVTTALETIERDEGRRLGLSSGANSLMFNLTPERYRDDYRIYPNKYHGREEMWERYGLYNEEMSYRMLEKKMFEAFEKG